MAIIKNQNVPADLYGDYQWVAELYYHIGFKYYDTTYGYTPILVVKKRNRPYARIDDILLGNPFYRERALYRLATIITADYWNVTLDDWGTYPPYTGSRSKTWWRNNKPAEIRSPYNYYFQHSVNYLKFKSFAPWLINPYIYVADNGNKLITKYNCNTFEKILSVGNTGDILFNFSDIASISVDENYLFVCENTNKRIICFNKTDFTTVKTISTYSGSETPFGNLKEIFSDDKYLYICDYNSRYLIKQSITNKNDFSGIIIQLKPGEEPAKLNNIHASFDWLYVYDLQNKRLTTYYKPANLKIHYDNINLLNCPMASTLNLWAIGNNETKIITMYAQGMFHEITTVGQGAEHNFNFQAIDGFCISGNLLLVLDNTSKKLFQISTPDYSLVNEFNITGLFSDVKQIIAEPQNYFYIEK